MLNQLLKFTLVSSLLLWLRPRWRGLLALVVFVLLVHVLHGEYLGYVELSGNDTFLLWSFALKWLALVAGVLVYFVFAVRGPNQGQRKKSSARTSTHAPAHPPASERVAAGVTADDGFDFLRNKKALQGDAEKLLGDDSQG